MRGRVLVVMVAVPFAAVAQEVRMEVRPVVRVQPEVRAAPMFLPAAPSVSGAPRPMGPGVLVAPGLMGVPLANPGPVPPPSPDGLFDPGEVRQFLEQRLLWEAAPQFEVGEPRLEEDGSLAVDLEGPPGVPRLRLSVDPLTGAIAGR
ncbi:hypothetical protein SH611_13445 [Geminicoccaceae bacterium 1502E]|nr:hypothetical protein [Geminicoccaceae bacterium 1502E]